MSSTGFGEDRPYGAIDDDDDFIEEWRSSWEPTPRSHINEVIEPVVVSVPEHGSYEFGQRSYETEPSPSEAAPVDAEVAEPVADEEPDVAPEGTWQPEPIAEYAPEAVTEAPAEPETPAEYQLSDLELERVYEQGLYAPSVAEPVAEPAVELVVEPVAESVVDEPAAFPQPFAPESEPMAFAQPDDEPIAPVEEPVVEQPAALAEEPVASPYDIESIHAGIASDSTLARLAATVVAAHPLTPVVAPEPVAEQWTPPVAPEPEFTPEPVAEQWTPPIAPEPEFTPEPVAEQWIPPIAPEPEPELADEPEPVAEVPEAEPVAEPVAPAAEAFAEFAAPAEPEAPPADTFAEAEESVELVVEAVPEVSPSEEIAEHETMYEQPGAWQPASDDAAADDAAAAAAANDTVPPATPIADADIVDEPEIAPLEAPDDYDGMELVEWEPEPLAAFGPPVEAPAVDPENAPTIESSIALPERSDIPAEQVADEALSPDSSPEPEAAIEPESEIAPAPEPEIEAEPVAEPEPVVEYESATEPTEDPDYSVGLAGAAAAALAAAAAWGVWGQPAASVAELFVEPEPTMEPEPYAEPETEPTVDVEPEPYAEPEPVAKLAVSDSETWVAMSMDTTPIPEPEAVTAAAPDAWASSDLETTPIPEPEAFTPPEPEAFAAAEPEASADEIFDADSSFTIAPVVAPELSAHEQVHAWADQTTTYDLSVDVTSILGTAMHFAPPEVAGVAPQATDPQRQVVVNDQLADAIFDRPSVTEPVADSPFAPPAVPIDLESPLAAAAEPAELAPFASPADTYTLPSYEPVEIRPYESSYAPVVEHTEAAPAATEAPATEEAAWLEPVPSAPAWPTETTGEAEPAPEHADAPHEHGASSWLERAKARVADIYYDPDADAPVIPEDEGGQTR
ncbi:MAG: hypothetical protein ACOH16_02135 [Propionibacteriaceae bacterium]